MEAELSRSMNELKLPSLPKPYYIALRVLDKEIGSCSATLGSPLNSYHTQSRSLEIDMHIGSYSFDNTNYYPGGWLI